MNQGNPPGKFEKDNGVHQDGGLIFHFPGQDQWVAIFLKFQSQGWHTDDKTGNMLDLGGGGPPSNGPGEPGEIPPDHIPTTDKPDGLVRIVAALINDIRSPEQETVTLLNTTAQDIDLAGWSLKDKMKAAFPLNGTLPGGEALRVRIAPPMALSNKGGIISAAGRSRREDPWRGLHEGTGFASLVGRSPSPRSVACLPTAERLVA